MSGIGVPAQSPVEGALSLAPEQFLKRHLMGVLHVKEGMTRQGRAMQTLAQVKNGILYYYQLSVNSISQCTFKLTVNGVLGVGNPALRVVVGALSSAGELYLKRHQMEVKFALDQDIIPRYAILMLVQVSKKCPIFATR